MNAAMNVKGQHEFHPDAESLNAFVEQALGERERGQVLEHLAACGRCRQVVALAREAAGAEVMAGATRRAAVRSHAWWRGWGLALAPAAALAATAAVAIYVHVRHVEQTAEMAKVESQRATRSPETVSAPTKPQQAEAVLVAPAPVASEVKALKSARSSEAPGERGRAPVVAAAMPEAGTMDRTEMAHEAEILHEEPASAPGTEAKGLAGESVPGTGGSAFFKQEPGEVASQPEQSRRAEAARSGVPAGSTTETVTVQAEDRTLRTSTPSLSPVANAQLEPKVEPVKNLPTPRKSKAGGLFAARMAHSFHLPSGLPAVSIASAGHLMLAVDQAGALFLSEDQGGTWEPVLKQWTGRAVAVRRQAAGSGNAETAPAAEAETPGNAAGTATAPQPAAAFEILNDQSQVWASADGKIWIAK
jgi:hypothetical protein